MPRFRSKVIALLAATSAATAAAVALIGSQPAGASAPVEYVAMGDSYTAGPLIPSVSVATTSGWSAWPRAA